MKTKTLKSLLMLGLAIASSGVMATETGVEGTGSTTDTLIDSVSWLPLNGGGITVTPDASFPAGNAYHCVVTCAATFKNPFASTDANYYLGISSGTSNPSSNTQMVVSFPSIDPNIDDIGWAPVTTTYLFSNLTGTKTFNCKARKFDTALDKTTSVENARITAVCSDHKW